jgi:uncharacterized protein
MDIVLISLLTLVAAAVGTLTGFGTSTIMVPVLLSFFPLGETLLLAGIVHWFGNIWKMLLFREGIRWRLILSFGIPGIAAGAAGGMLVTRLNEELLSRVLGAALVIYVVFLVVNRRFRLPQSTAWAVAGGTLSGFLAGVFGIGGAVRGAFLAAFDLPKAVYIATSGAIDLAVDSARLASYLWSGISLTCGCFGDWLRSFQRASSAPKRPRRSSIGFLRRDSASSSRCFSAPSASSCWSLLEGRPTPGNCRGPHN